MTHVQVYTPTEDPQPWAQRTSLGSFFLIPVLQPALVFLLSTKPPPGRPDYTGAQEWIKELDLCCVCVCVCMWLTTTLLSTCVHNERFSWVVQHFLRQGHHSSLLFSADLEKWHPSWRKPCWFNPKSAAIESNVRPTDFTDAGIWKFKKNVWV